MAISRMTDIHFKAIALNWHGTRDNRLLPRRNISEEKSAFESKLKQRKIFILFCLKYGVQTAFSQIGMHFVRSGQIFGLVSIPIPT